MSQQAGTGNVIGRDRLIERTWRKLESDSLRFTAERRIGKTTVMKKMMAEPRPGWRVVYIDLEGVSSPEGFAEALLTRARQHIPKGQIGQQSFRKILEAVGGTEIGGLIKLPEFSQKGWRSTIEKSFAGICSHLGKEKLLILFDELPYMLQKIAAYQIHEPANENHALEMLDTLRAIREEHNQNLRMIFAGSVGLHHVITALRGSEFASQPVNNMPLIEIKALRDGDARTLAKRLLQAEDVEIDRDLSIELLAETLAKETDRVPFYLERVIARMAEMDRPVVLEDVVRLVNYHLTSDHDHWEMAHFRDRLSIYYPGNFRDANERSIQRVQLVSEVLDFLACASEPQSIEQVWHALKAKFAIADRTIVPPLLSLLAQDHYLVSDESKRYAFRFPLIQRWWVLAQGLAS